MFARQFSFVKAWAAAHVGWLLARLEPLCDYGETCPKKHAVFYGALPHHFFEFDVPDRKTGAFLSTAALLAGGPVPSAPVFYEGIAPRRLACLTALLRPSLEHFLFNLLHLSGTSSCADFTCRMQASVD